MGHYRQTAIASYVPRIGTLLLAALALLAHGGRSNIALGQGLYRLDGG